MPTLLDRTAAPRRRPRAPLAAALAALPFVLTALLAGCSSTPPKAGVGGLGDSPVSLAGFPSTAVLDAIHVEARFYNNHEDLFEEDLIRSYSVLPVALRLWLGRGARMAEEPRKSVRDMGLRLILPDGSICAPVPHESITRRRPRTQQIIDERAIQDGFIGSTDQAREEFVFFRLPEIAEYVPGSHMITLEADGVTRTVDLSKSLLGFDLLVERDLRTVYIGLNRSRWTRGR